MEGLTFQNGLDRFWLESVPPDAELFSAFRATVMYGSLVNGGFYSDTGISLAAAGASERLVAERSPLEELLLS
jgi:capsular polysaccharide export protein